MRRRNSLKLTISVIIIAILAIFVGYFIGNWLIQIVMGDPDSGSEMTGKKVIEEEIIDSNDNDGLNNNNEINQNTSTNQKEDVNNNENEIDEKEFIIDNKSEDIFVIQVGAFSNYENAQSLKENLSSKGFEVVITEEKPYKVQVLASENREESEKIEKEIEALGYNTFITH
ncbi:MAG: SPOR domain-containing protein [Bacillota bacterium]